MDDPEQEKTFWEEFWERYQWFSGLSGMFVFDLLAVLIFLGMVCLAAQSMDLMSGDKAEQFAGMIALAVAAQGLLLVGIYAAIRDLRRG